MRHYGSEKPVSDQLFQAYKSLYSYEHTSLHPVVESTEQADDWKLEQSRSTLLTAVSASSPISFSRRKRRRLFKPSCIFLALAPGTFTPAPTPCRCFSRTSISSSKVGAPLCFRDKGTFERGAERQATCWPTLPALIAITSSRVEAPSRPVDYPETRPHIDTIAWPMKVLVGEQLWVGSFQPSKPALRPWCWFPRGFYLQQRLPEVDQLNFAPRVKAPVLMLNGRFDFIWPPTPSQEPMFRLLYQPTKQAPRWLRFRPRYTEK